MHLEYDAPLENWEWRDLVEQLFTNIIDEYVGEHFEESTTAAVQLLHVH